MEMSYYGPLFDSTASQEAKASGMTIAAENQPGALEMAREIALSIATEGDGRCNADQVGRRMKGLGYEETGPWAGSIFKGEQWEFTGERVRSARTSNHGRELKVWRLNDRN